eukprot:g19055.t1
MDDQPSGESDEGKDDNPPPLVDSDSKAESTMSYGSDSDDGMQEATTAPLVLMAMDPREVANVGRLLEETEQDDDLVVTSHLPSVAGQPVDAVAGQQPEQKMAAPAAVEESGTLTATKLTKVKSVRRSNQLRRA